MKRKPVNFERLLDLRAWMADPYAIIGSQNSLSSIPAKKVKKKKKIKKTKVEIEDISDGNL